MIVTVWQRCWKPSFVGHRCYRRSVRDWVSEYLVESEVQLADCCIYRYLPGLALTAQTGLEVAEGGVIAWGGHLRDGEDLAHGDAATSNAAEASLCAAVLVQRSRASQGGHLTSVEATRFR